MAMKQFLKEKSHEEISCVALWNRLRPTALLRDWNGPYVELLEEYVKKLDERLLFASEIHGGSHILRTMILATKVGEELALDQEGMKLVLLAASYHDTGRIDDSYDVDHGRRSAQRWPGDASLCRADDCLVRGMMAAHSQPDSKMEEILESYGNIAGERELALSQLLKDADGLDRVRVNYLDPTFLRHEPSLNHIFFAEKLFQLTKEVAFTPQPMRHMEKEVLVTSVY